MVLTRRSRDFVRPSTTPPKIHGLSKRFRAAVTGLLRPCRCQASAKSTPSRLSLRCFPKCRAPRKRPQIAHDLNVDAVVEGTVLRSGEKVRITAQLILASADKHLWARSYEGDLRDALALQNEVARSIASEIRVELTPREDAVLRARR